MDSTGDHPATEQKYHADANFALPGPGDLPRAPAATVPGDELLASREEWPAAAGTEPALGASRLAADPGSPAMSNPGPAAPLMRLRERMLAHVIAAARTSAVRPDPGGPGLVRPGTYFATGSKPWYHEFHWHGLQLLAGNSAVLTGLACLAALVVAAVLCRTRERPRELGP